MTSDISDYSVRVPYVLVDVVLILHVSLTTNITVDVLILHVSLTTKISVKFIMKLYLNVSVKLFTIISTYSLLGRHDRPPTISIFSCHPGTLLTCHMSKECLDDMKRCQTRLYSALYCRFAF